MTTYKKIQEYVKEKHGYTAETCWIAHVKSDLGLPMRKAHNRQGDGRKKRCPDSKRGDIESALRHFKMI